MRKKEREQARKKQRKIEKKKERLIIRVVTVGVYCLHGVDCGVYTAESFIQDRSR